MAIRASSREHRATGRALFLYWLAGLVCVTFAGVLAFTNLGAGDALAVLAADILMAQSLLFVVMNARGARPWHKVLVTAGTTCIGVVLLLMSRGVSDTHDRSSAILTALILIASTLLTLGIDWLNDSRAVERVRVGQESAPE